MDRTTGWCEPTCIRGWTADDDEDRNRDCQFSPLGKTLPHEGGLGQRQVNSHYTRAFRLTREAEPSAQQVTLITDAGIASRKMGARANGEQFEIAAG